MTKKQKEAAAAKLEAARAELLAAGCTFEKKEDRYGFTETGWWQDGVFLSRSAHVALSVLKGN